ncbi:CRE-SRG-11 protein [Caenorhabditis remanei]|uniref:Serpentine receptor class gamma n=1 Tax=Caenorhabditis remanei TaxID=31234 RepID=E3MCV0_CAERE|nr:CRE-SRG-11 protein [Caenorhabditis remanei]
MPDTIFRANISNEYDPIVFNCSSDYEKSTEIVKYILQIVYLIPGGLLNILIIRTILFKHWEIYGKNSFFMIYSTDCIISFVMISIDIVVRMFIYFTPLCPVLAPYFFEPLIVFKVIMIIINHSKASKSIIQIFLVLNRMSCVLYPLKYSLMWKKPVKLVIVSIFVIPFTTDWNLIISRVYMQPTFGGFYMEYIKKVSWIDYKSINYQAGQSRFQLFFISIALIFTVICTSITFYSLITLPKRIKNVEKSLSFATAYISMSFIVLAVFQILFAFFSSIFTTSAVFGYALLSYDILNVGFVFTCFQPETIAKSFSSPIILICVSRKLRCHVFGLQSKKPRVARVFSMTVSQIPKNSELQEERYRKSVVLERVNY